MEKVEDELLAKSGFEKEFEKFKRKGSTVGQDKRSTRSEKMDERRSKNSNSSSSVKCVKSVKSASRCINANINLDANFVMDANNIQEVGHNVLVHNNVLEAINVHNNDNVLVHNNVLEANNVHDADNVLVTNNALEANNVHDANNVLDSNILRRKLELELKIKEGAEKLLRIYENIEDHANKCAEENDRGAAGSGGGGGGGGLRKWGRFEDGDGRGGSDGECRRKIIREATVMLKDSTEKVERLRQWLDTPSSLPTTDDDAEAIEISMPPSTDRDSGEAEESKIEVERQRRHEEANSSPLPTPNSPLTNRISKIQRRLQMQTKAARSARQQLESLTVDAAAEANEGIAAAGRGEEEEEVRDEEKNEKRDWLSREGRARRARRKADLNVKQVSFKLFVFIVKKNKTGS